MSNADEARGAWPDNPELLETVLNQVKREHSQRILFDKMLLRLCYQRPIVADPDPMRPYRDVSAFETLIQLGFNTCRKVIDAARSRICRPLRPVVMPVGADHELERSCTVLTRAIDGILDTSKFWTFHAPQVFADACRTTMGHLEWEFDEETGQFVCERGDPLSYFWHYDEGRNPANLYAEYPASKVMLAAKFPKHREAIMKLPTWKQPTIIGVEPPGIRGTDTVRVCKAWRRKLGKHTGRHVVTAGPVVLVDEPWEFDFFPVAACRWDQDFRGYGGFPGAAVLAPYQRWQNSIMRVVFDSAKAAVPWLVVHADDIVDHVSDAPMQKVVWDGTRAPQIVSNNPISNQLLEFAKQLDSAAHAEFGMNQAAAEGSMPAGLNSAPAQRERMAIVDSRLSRLQDAWENLAVDSARIIVGLASKYLKDKAVRVRVPGGNRFDEVKWPFDLNVNQFQMQFTKLSGLTATGWGRIQQIGELRDRGAITENNYLRQLELPDIQATVDLITSAEDLALQHIDEALDDAKFNMPSALMFNADEIDNAITLGQQKYRRALISKKYPAKNLECLRRYIQALQAIKTGTTSIVINRPVPATLPGQPAGVSPMPSAVLPSMNAPNALPLVQEPVLAAPAPVGP